MTEIIGCMRAVCPDKTKCSTEGKCQNPMHADPQESYRNALLWAFDRLSVTGGMDAASQRRTMKEIGNVLIGLPSPASIYRPNDWDESAHFNRER